MSLFVALIGLEIGAFLPCRVVRAKFDTFFFVGLKPKSSSGLDQSLRGRFSGRVCRGSEKAVVISRFLDFCSFFGRIPLKTNRGSTPTLFNPRSKLKIILKLEEDSGTSSSQAEFIRKLVFERKVHLNYYKKLH